MSKNSTTLPAGAPTPEARARAKLGEPAERGWHSSGDNRVWYYADCDGETYLFEVPISDISEWAIERFRRGELPTTEETMSFLMTKGPDHTEIVAFYCTREEGEGEIEIYARNGEDVALWSREALETGGAPLMVSLRRGEVA